MLDVNSDVQLLKAFINRQEWAFNEIYALYHQQLLFFVKKIVGNLNQAEDIVAESFFKLLKRQEEFESLQALKFFLIRTAQNASIDLIRAQKRHAASHAELKYLNNYLENETERAIIRSELVSILNAEINKLPPQYAEIIRRAYIQGQSITEIAEHMGLAYKTIQNLKAKALQQLRLRLPGEDVTALLLCIYMLL